jgi:hypothetical protein
MSAVHDLFFLHGLSKPDSFIFDSFFANPTGTRNPMGAGAKFHLRVRMQLST